MVFRARFTLTMSSGFTTISGSGFSVVNGGGVRARAMDFPPGWDIIDVSLAVVPLSVLIFLLTMAPALGVVFEQVEFNLEKRLSEACNTVL